jgi:chitin synthase
MRRKGGIKWMPTVKEGVGSSEAEGRDQEDDDGGMSASVSHGGTPCVAGKFRVALDMLFETLDETQPWYIFCINPNDMQLPNQLEGRSIKGQVRSIGLSEIRKRCANVFEVGMTLDEFCQGYREGLEGSGVVEGNIQEWVQQAQQAHTAFGLSETDLILGQHKVSGW